MARAFAKLKHEPHASPQQNTSPSQRQRHPKTHSYSRSPAFRPITNTTMVSSENFTFSILNHAGTPLPEYENPFQSAEDVAAGVVSVYVETPPSTDPQNFTIKIAAIKPINYTAHAGYYFDTFFDGVRSAHGIALRRHYAGRSNGATISSFSEIDEAGRNYVDKELMFKPMELENDGPSLAAMRRDANFNPLDVGSIKIQFKEIAGETAAPTVVCYKPKLGAIGGKVNEKAMKGGSSTHSIGYVLAGRCACADDWIW